MRKYSVIKFTKKHTPIGVGVYFVKGMSSKLKSFNIIATAILYTP